MYVQKGTVKFTVVNESGKEAVVAIFGSGDFFGEGGMAGQKIRIATATAVVPSTVLIIEKDEMTRVLHTEHALSDRFISHILARNIRVEADLDRSTLQFDGEKTGTHASCCLLVMARKANPRRYCRKFRRRPLRK